MAARFAEYVPRDILAATDGLDLDLDLNELMVRGLRPNPYLLVLAAWDPRCSHCELGRAGECVCALCANV